MPDVIANGVRLHYEERGSGEETIVFSHSYALNSSHFAPQLEAFGDRYRCLAFDHRGHGLSEISRDGYGMENLYADAVAFLEALDCGPCHFVGLSTGGFIGQRLALRRPDLLRSLVLMDTSADPEPRKKRIQYGVLFAISKRLGMRPLLGQVMPIFFGQKFLRDPARKADVQRMRDILLSNDISAQIKFGHGIFGRESMYEKLGQITTPTLVMVGEKDVPTPPAKAQRIADAIPGAELVVIPDAGHIGPLEEPAAVNAALERWLAKV